MRGVLNDPLLRICERRNRERRCRSVHLPSGDIGELNRHHAPVTTIIRQPTWVRAVCASSGTGLGVVAVAAAVTHDGIVLVGSLGAAVVASLVAYRSWHLRVELGDAVILANWLRTVRIPWSDVERFGLDGGGVWVRCRNLRQVRISAFLFAPGAWSPARQSARRAVRDLEAARKRRRRRGGGPDRARHAGSASHDR